MEKEEKNVFVHIYFIEHETRIVTSTFESNQSYQNIFQKYSSLHADQAPSMRDYKGI